MHKSILRNTDAAKLLENSYGVSEATQAKNRNELYNQVTSRYESMKELGILQAQFVFKDNIVFLRTQKPSKFGDDVSQIRVDYAYANEYKKPMRTFAQGRVAHGFRNTFPIFNDKNEHIGAMEISFSSEEFQRYLGNISQIHSHFIVNKNIFDATIWNEKDLVLKYGLSAENQGYMLTLCAGHNEKDCIIENKIRLAPIKEEIERKMLRYKPFSSYVAYKDEITVASFLPIENIENKNLAWLVSYKESAIIKSSLGNTFIVRVITFFLSIIIILFLIKIISSKQKIDEQNKLLQDLIDSTDNIMFITNFKDIKFSNHQFHSFVNQEYNIFDRFISTEGFLHKGLLEEDENFASLVQRTPAEDRIISMLGKNLELKAFKISISDSVNNSDFIVSLTDITKMKEHYIATEKKAYHDELTNVYNRYKFNQELEEELKLTKRYHHPFSIAILDIDKFKNFNDTYGHLIGDEVLISMAQTITTHVRETDIFARWGGEEFVILFKNTSIDEAKYVSEMLRNKIKSKVHPIAGSITVSFGVSEYKEGDTQKSIFKRCDDALYMAKANGRDRVEVL
ncbi:MAG: diguanylate cyclase [Sulfurimonadaceae bacterium]|nr:diguanylate cyclase [Sulfurimonadaceae bacterium]